MKGSLQETAWNGLGDTIETKHIDRVTAFPNIPDKKLVVNVSAEHPFAVWIKVTIKK